MAPFLAPKIAVTGVKERVDSLSVQANNLYLGTSSGSLYMYSIQPSKCGCESEVSLVEVKKGLSRRSIEQLGYVQNENSLVVLSDSSITLYPLPALSPPTPLVKAKSAFSFAVNTSVEQVLSDEMITTSDNSSNAAKPMPLLVTQLLVGCQRKVVVYTWKGGEMQVKEAQLSHSPRAISFLGPDTACFAYPKDFAMFSISTMTAIDVVIPTTATTSIGALTGIMTLGLGAKPKPGLISIGADEILISRDNSGYFFGSDGKLSRPSIIEWPSFPEEIAHVKPYIIAVLPAGAVSLSQGELSITGGTGIPPPHMSTASIQIRSSLTPHTAQTFPFPFIVSSSDIDASQTLQTTPSTPHSAAIRLLTPSTAKKSPLFFVTTPIDRITATAEGSTIWQLSLKPWSDQLDELVVEGRYSDALDLLNTLDEATLPDKAQRCTLIRALNAVSQFRSSQYDVAIDTFLALDCNPAKVIALYPESVAGRLSVPPEKWIALYGGPSPRLENSTVITEGEQMITEKDNTQGARPSQETLEPVSTSGSLRGRFQKAGLGIFASNAPRDDDTMSITGKRKAARHDNVHQSVETLVRYLGDRRPKLKAALEAVGITPQNQSHRIAPLSETSVDELFALPNAPLPALTPEQLLRFAQIVDTALYKSLLIIRPALLQSLCRIANWCEVSEVEEDLRARQKFSELKDLYHGKKMHAEALQLLRELSEQDTNLVDQLQPSIFYLQKLGPEYLPHIFEYSRWIFNKDLDMAFDIFTSEDVDLPRQPVLDFLKGIDPTLCIRYLEFIINERHEDSPLYHNNLVDFRFDMCLGARRRNDDNAFADLYSKFLDLIKTNQKFSISRLYGRLSSTDFFEARAILIGRLGRHDQALELYVYQLRDYVQAEEYCKSVYQPGTETSGVFLTLLRIYLRPSINTPESLLQPALDLINRHHASLDPVETIELIPPLVTVDNLRAFLIETLRVPAFNTRVIRHISKARNDQVARQLMFLQSRRVKVSDSRICPQCHKRIGHSVIAVHTLRGEVTHYQCREAFASRLSETR